MGRQTVAWMLVGAISHSVGRSNQGATRRYHAQVVLDETDVPRIASDEVRW